MRRILGGLLLLLCSEGIAFETQLELNEKACQRFSETDQKLNEVYNHILKAYKDDPLFIKNLKTAQKAWIVYRDRHLDALYTPGEHWGSINPFCRCGELERLTQERLLHLESWLRQEEGDGCAGTRRPDVQE